MPTNIKQLLLGAAVIISASASWYFYNVLFFKGAESFWSSAIYFLISLSFFSIFLFLVSLLIVSLPLRLLIFSLSFFSIFLFLPFNYWIGSAAVLFFIFAISGGRNAKKENNLLLKFDFSKSAGRGLSGFTSGFVIFTAISLWISPLGFSGQIKIPKNFFDATIKSSVPIISKQIPAFSADMTIDGLITALLEKQMSGQAVNVKEIMPSVTAEQEKAIKSILAEQSRAQTSAAQKILNEQRKQFSNMLGQKLKGNEKIGDILYNFTNDLIANSLNSSGFKDYVPFVVIFLIFLSLKPFSFIFKWLFAIVGFLTFQTLKLSGFIKTAKVMTEKETITL